VVAAIYGTLVVLAVAAKVSSRWGGWPDLVRRALGPLAPEPRLEERLATIITKEGEAVAARILEELGRGVTGLKGTGMYTGAPRVVLLCAVTSVQVAHLRDIVQQIDSEAFVVVSIAEEVRGGGFRPFEPPS
jgi:hypothetical protein